MSSIFDDQNVDIERDVIDEALIHSIKELAKFSESVHVTVTVKSLYQADDCTRQFRISKVDIDRFLLSRSIKRYNEKNSFFSKVKSWFK